MHSKHRKLIARISSLVLLGLVLAGCQRQAEEARRAGATSEQGASGNSANAAAGVLQVVATNYPLEYFASRIGGDRVRVEFPMAGEGDPMEWAPTSAGVQALQKADLIITNGATYEKWLSQVTLPEASLVDTSANFSDRLIEVQDAVTHQHGPEGEHSHAGTAFTTWIDFELAARQATAVAAAFSTARPQWTEEFAQRLQPLLQDLAAVDAAMQTAAKSWSGHPLVVSHPVYHYWARRYQLDTHPVHWEPDVVPDPTAVQELKSLLESHPAKVMIWEDEPTTEIAELVKGLGLSIIVFNPTGNRPATGDWLSQMQANIANLQNADAASGPASVN